MESERKEDESLGNGRVRSSEGRDSAEQESAGQCPRVSQLGQQKMLHSKVPSKVEVVGRQLRGFFLIALGYEKDIVSAEVTKSLSAER